MKASDDLFHLIKSLTKNEKGYFKKHSSIHIIGEQNKYLALFDAIDKQSEYDERAIKSVFKKERFIKQLHVAKNYLFQQILNSCERYNSSINNKLKSKIIQAEILLDKLLFKQCEKLLKQIHQTALKYEKYTALLDILALENKLTRRIGYGSKGKDEIESEFRLELNAIEKYRNIIEYRNQTSTMHVAYWTDRKISGNLQFRKTIKHSLFTSEKKALSVKAKSLFFLGKGSYYSFINDHNNTYIYSNALVKLLESNPQFIEENPPEYHNALKNLIASLVNKNRYSEIPPLIEKLKSVDVKSKHLIAENFFYINHILMVVEINLGRFSKGIQLITQIQKEIKSSKANLIKDKNEIIFNYCFAYINFGVGNFLKANTFFHKIINNTSNYKGDYYWFARVFIIIINYEMGKDDLLEYNIKSTYRHLSEKKKLHKFEKILFDFFLKKAPEINSRKDSSNAFRYLKNKVLKIVKDPNENSAFFYFEFISWFESKIENRPFAEIVLEKATRAEFK